MTIRPRLDGYVRDVDQMLRRFLMTMTILAGAFMAPTPAQAATVQLEMHNCFFRPWSIVAQTGDTVEIKNLGGPKTVQSYSGTEFGPENVPTNGTISFVYGGSLTGLQASDTTPNPDPQAAQCTSTVTEGQCTGMCARVTPSGPQNPPAQPTIATPTEGQQITSNVVTFSGTAVNAKQVRINVQPVNQTFFGVVDSNGNYAVNRQLPNGAFTAKVIGMHLEGYETTATTVAFSIAGGDTSPPVIQPGNPARIAGQPSQARIGQSYIGHGRIFANGVVVDDVQAKKVTATIRNANIPDSEQAIQLTCFNPDAFGTAVPCNATQQANPWRIQYTGSVTPGLPGQYLLTISAEDGLGQTAEVTQEIFYLGGI